MKQGKFLLGIAVGAAVGAAVSYLLTSGKGKELATKLKDMAGGAKEQADEGLAKAEAEVEEWLTKGKDWLSNNTNS